MLYLNISKYKMSRKRLIKYYKRLKMQKKDNIL